MGLLTGYVRNLRLRIIREYVKGDILDLGCGPADNLVLAGHLIRDYYGVDCDKELMSLLRARHRRAHFFAKDLDKEELDFDKKFDVIIMLAVVEHLYNQKHLFEQAVKCLKPNGRIIITTPTPFGNDVIHRLGSLLGVFSKAAADEHIVIYNRKRFEILAGHFGMRIEKYRPFEFYCNQLVVLTPNNSACLEEIL